MNSCCDGVSFHVVIHMKKPLNYRCHMGTQWTIPVVCLHALYVATLVGFTGAIHHIEFRFHELKDLWRGILVSTSSIGIYCSLPSIFHILCLGCVGNLIHPSCKFGNGYEINRERPSLGGNEPN